VGHLNTPIGHFSDKRIYTWYGGRIRAAPGDAPPAHHHCVRAYIGTGPHGDVFGDPAILRAFVEDSRRLVRSARAVRKWSARPPSTSDQGLMVPVGSTVTVWVGTPRERTARVITATCYNHPSAWSHLELALT